MINAGVDPNYDPSNNLGRITIDGYTPCGGLEGFTGGSLVNIAFTVLSNAPVGGAIINLRQSVTSVYPCTLPTAAHSTSSSDAAQGNYFLMGGPSNTGPSDGADVGLDGLITIHNGVNSTTTLTSSTNPSVFGQSVTFTATVNGADSGTPTGTVTFNDNGTSIGTGSVTGGLATFTTTTLTVATHTITAVYGGDNDYFASSGSLTQTVNDGLIVSSFAATATGFTAVFNHALNLGNAFTPILNLYDNSTGTLGPADVTLVGTASGAIRGSLVVDAVAGRSGSDGNTRITFIQTGQTGVLGSAAQSTLFGVLPNDTYTVTLRSASNGFQDTSGNLLDGNGDGTAGDNYVTTFVVNNASNSVTVSLPDLARGPGQLVNVPNTAPANDTFTNGLPLRLYNNDSTGSQTITSVALTLAYNPSLLNVTGYSTAGLGDPGDSAVTTFDTSTAGLVNITFTTSTGIVLGPDGSRVVLTLESNVPSTAVYQAKEILDLQNIQINGGSITAVDDAAIHVAGFLGDATGDGIYTGLDAQRISRVAVGLDPGFRQWVLADPLIVGDVNGDNQLTGLDACEIAREAVGITQASVPVLPAVTPAIVGPDPVVSIGKVSGEWLVVSGESAGVVVPVNLDHSDGLVSVNLAISYDTSRVDVASAADVVRGSLTRTFDNFTVNIDRAAGIIYISGYRSAGPLAGFGGGSLALITFHIKDNAPAGAAVINLLENAGSAWTALGGTDGQGNDFLFDLQPRPSNAAGDALDGRIDVLSPVAAGVLEPVLGDEQAPCTDQRGDLLWLQMGNETDAGTLSILTSGLEVSSELFRVGAGAWQPSDDVWLGQRNSGEW